MDRRPYLLNPNKPPEGEPRRLFQGETETELAPAMQERARALDLVMRRPQWSPNTMPAHEATVYAREKGRDDQFHHTAAGAYWERSADIADVAVLKEIAEGTGLDWAELGPRLESGQYREEVLQEYQAARDRGVSGTPTYFIGGQLMGGDIGLEDLRAAVQKAAAG